MPIPETVAIINLSFGLIRSVLNTTEDIYERKDDWGRYAGKLQDGRDKLREVGRRLERWHRRWMIFGETRTTENKYGVPKEDNKEDFDTLFEYLWGKDYKEIKDRLESVESDVQKLEPYLNKFIAKLGAGRFKRALGKAHLNIGADKGITKTWESIKTNLDGLELVCDNLFRDKFAGDNDTRRKELTPLDDRYIRFRVLQESLTHIAQNTNSISTKLYRACFAERGGLKLRLFIDMFEISADTDKPWRDRLGSILKAFTSRENDTLNFTFVVHCPEVHQVFSLRTQVRGTTKEPEHARNAFSLAFSDIWNGDQNTQRFFTSPAPEPVCWFSMKAIMPPLEENQGYTEVLENVQDGIPPTLDKNRAKTAYVLAEFGFLFLGTNWLRGLCRCRLWQRELVTGAESKNMMSLNFREVIEQANWPGNNGPQCWCKAERLPYAAGRVLPYIGLLLGEIAICKPVRAEYVDGDSPPTLKINGQVKTLQEFNQDVLHRSGSDEYAGAVRHCLDENADNADRGTYYRKVLAPLQRIYDNFFMDNDPNEDVDHQLAMGN